MNLFSLMGIAFIIVGLLLFIAGQLGYSYSKASTRQEFEIKDVIQSVRHQLLQSQLEREAAGEEPMFIVQSFDLEVHAAIKESSAATGKADAKVVILGAEDSTSRERSTKITIRMKTTEDAPVPFPE